MLNIELKKQLGYLALTILASLCWSCEFGAENGVVPVGLDMVNPVEGLMAVANDKHVLVMDEVVNPDKSRVRSLKVFDRSGELKMSRTESGLATDRCQDCGGIVSLGGPQISFDQNREARFLAMYENGRVWELVCNFERGTILPNNLYSNFVQEPNARLNDFDYVGRLDGQTDGVIVFRWPGQGCGPLHPFLQWEPTGAPRQTIDLEPWLGCAPQYLRVAVDKNSNRITVLGGDKLLNFRINRDGELPLAEFERELDLPVRPDRIYADIATQAGLIAVSERTTGGDANRDHSVFLFSSQVELLDQKTAKKVNAIAFSSGDDRSGEVPIFIWYSGLDFDAEFNVMRRQVVANLD